QDRVDQVFFRQRRDSLRALEEFTRRTHSIAELERPAHELVDVIRVAMQTSGVALLQPSDTGDFVTVATSGREEIGFLQISRNSPLVLFLDREQEPLEQRRLDFDPRLQALANNDRQLLQAAGAMVLVPLRMRDHLSGILALGAKLSEEPYSREELTLLSLVATQTTVLLDDARLYQRTTVQLLQDRRRVEAFGTAVGQLGLEQDPGHALQKLVDTARELVGARHGALDVWDEEGQMLRRIVSGSPVLNNEAALASLRGPEEEGARANNGDRSITPGGSYHPFAPLAPPVRSSRNGVLSIPVLVKGKSRGVLYLVEKPSANEFSQDDERLAGLFAGVAGVLLDNTDLFSSVTQEKSTLAAILASMAEGLAVLGPDGHLELWNNAMELFTGMPAQEAVGRPWDEMMGRMAPDVENPQVLGPLREALHGSAMEPAVFEVTLVRPIRRQLLVKVFHIPEEAGAPLLGLLVRDMTQEKELEERRNSFISIASHELRTPMTTIVGFSEILLTHEVPREIRENWLRTIHQEGLRLSGIVDDLLDISRIQSGKMGVNLVRCALGVVVEEAVTLASPMATRHEVVVEIPPDLPEVWADKAKLVQVLTNLLTNAAKYSPAGGSITLSARHEPDGERVVVSLADQGIGIAPENQTQLFQSFQRVNRRETLGIRGTGLGLYIVKSFVEMMGGEVWVESELNRGSTFFFSLQARARNSAGPAQQRRDESAKESANS
ncbi:MAG: ATP-binding protein, partial [Chloroflexota bacterium]